MEGHETGRGGRNELRTLYEAKTFLIMKKFDEMSRYEVLHMEHFWEFLAERGKIMDNFRRGIARHMRRMVEGILNGRFPSDITSIIMPFVYPKSLLHVRKSNEAILSVAPMQPAYPIGAIKFDVLVKGKVISMTSIDDRGFSFHPIYTIQRKTYTNVWVKLSKKERDTRSEAIGAIAA